MKEFFTSFIDMITSFTHVDIFVLCSTVILILLVVYMIYLIRTEEPSSEYKKSNTDSLNKSDLLIEILNDLQKNYDPKPIVLTDDSLEKDSNIIISYDELIKKASNKISYDENYDAGFDDIVVKKVISNSETKEYVNSPKPIMMSYENEELFMEALKKLNKNLSK